MYTQTDCLSEARSMLKSLIENLESQFRAPDIYPVTINILKAVQEIDNISRKDTNKSRRGND